MLSEEVIQRVVEVNKALMRQGHVICTGSTGLKLTADGLWSLDDCHCPFAPFAHGITANLSFVAAVARSLGVDVPDAIEAIEDFDRLGPTYKRLSSELDVVLVTREPDWI